ncbi:MAG: fasciclin domain-containing protein [Salinibacter sp.]
MRIPTARLRGQMPLLAALPFIVFASLLAGCGSGEAPDEATRSPVELAGVPDSMTTDRVLRTDRRFSTLVRALDSTGLDSVLATEGPYTLFAPPDTAFAALPRGTVPALLAKRQDRLRTILAHHVVEGRVPLRALADTSVLTTLGGDTVRVQGGDSIRVGTARVLDGDVETANGLIHVIDAVLRPPSSNGGDQTGTATDADGP